MAHRFRDCGIDELAAMGEAALAAMARLIRDQEDERRDASLSWTYALRQNDWDAADWSGAAPRIDPRLSDTWSFRACVRSLLACGLRARLTRTGRFSCSRSKRWWSRKDRFRDLPYSYDLVMRALAWLVEAGLLDEVRASPFDHLITGLQSTYGATDLAVQLFPRMEFERVTEFQTIRMRNADRQMVQVPDIDEVRQMRAEVEAISVWLAGFQVILPDSLQPYGTGHLAYLNEEGVRCYVRWDGILRVYRQFCRSSLLCGGRLYGDWQSIPSEWRSGDGGMQIVVAGEAFATVEPDFEYQHARMLYARLRIKMPEGFDPYVVSGFHRDLGKLAFHVAVNSRGWVRTVCAIKSASEERQKRKAKKAARAGRALRPDEMALSFVQSAALLKAVKSHNRPVAKAFASDAGVGLQRDDCEILIAVLRRCMAAGVPALPVHDSVVCREIDEVFVRTAMETEMQAYEARFQAVAVEVSAPAVVPEELPPQNPGGSRVFLGSRLAKAKFFTRRVSAPLPLEADRSRSALEAGIIAAQRVPRPAVKTPQQPTYAEVAGLFRVMYGPNWQAIVEAQEATEAREHAFGLRLFPRTPTLSEIRNRDAQAARATARRVRPTKLATRPASTPTADAVAALIVAMFPGSRLLHPGVKRPDHLRPALVDPAT